jgi:thiosulfate/3-mercaptopyruvate sulfurtransferase
MRIVRLLTILTAIAVTPVAAADRRDALLVSTTWLAEHLNDKDLVLLHVGDAAEYRAHHLPHARLVSMLSSSDRSSGLNLEMPAADDLRNRLADLGISDTSRIVVYWANEWVSPATRVVFTLDYAGIGDRVRLLDGGMEAWVREEKTVTDAVPPAARGTLSPLKVRPLIADAAYVKAHLADPRVAIVDARTPGFYSGAQTGRSQDGAHKTGHIAGARSVPFGSVLDDRNYWRSTSELTDLFDKAGIKAGETVVTYCHIGQQATATLFAARLLGYPVMLYDGSFEDWSRHADYPVETTAKKND